MPERRWPPVSAAATVCAVTAAAIGTGLALEAVLPPDSVPLVFLLGVLVAAAAHGVWAGVAAAILASLSFNFFFIPPVFTLLVADREELFALAAFLVAGILTGSVAGRMRQQADRARRHAQTVESLNDYAGRLSGADDRAEIVGIAGAQIARTLHTPVVALTPDGDQLLPAGAWPDGAALSAEDWQAAGRAARTGGVARRPAEPDAGQRFEFHPVAGASQLVAVFGIARPPDPPASDEPALQALLRHAAIACARLEHAEEAAAARAAAREEQLRNAVLSSLSHDLRTPLATILGAASSLRELGPALSDEARDDFLGAIEDEARRLSLYVSNLLDMTRVEAGALSPALDWVDVADVLRLAASRARKDHPGLALSVAIPADLPLLRTDAALLGQALFNLLDNAAKHAGAGGPVLLSAIPEQATVALAVTDSGPGIPAALQPHVFDKFRRGVQQGSPSSGSGLGLAIARGIVAALGGELVLESPVEAGHGSRFTIRLPLAVSKTEEP
jgi:two-component system sensor histidine kinase KdpD